MEKKIDFPLYPKEIHQIKIQRKTKFGRLLVILHNGKPQRITKREKDIILKEDAELDKPVGET